VTSDHIACRPGTGPTTAVEILIIWVTVLNAAWILQACHRSNKEQQLSRLKNCKWIVLDLRPQKLPRDRISQISGTNARIPRATSTTYTRLLIPGRLFIM